MARDPPVRPGGEDPLRVESIRVLCVDDDPAFLDLLASGLPREDEALTVETTTRPGEVTDRLDRSDIECVVSDYDMPGTDGLALLDAVRADRPALPFILYTSKGSEEIASEAISAGVTDYVRKETGPDRFAVLAHRIRNAVVGYRSRRTIERREERLQALMQWAMDITAVLDEKGRYEYISPSFERILGYEPGERTEFIGDVSFQYVHPDDRDDVVEAFETALDDPSATPRVEYRYRDADGGWRVLETIGTNRLDDPAIEGFVVNTRDVTDRVEREAELRTERDRFRTLFENLPLSVVHASGDADALEPVVERVNPRFEETFGLDADEAVGENLLDLIVPAERREHSRELLRRAVGTGRVHEEVRRETADGLRDFRLDVVVRNPEGDSPEGYAVYTDITERKEREESLRRYEAIVENTEDGIYVFDDEGRFEFVNRRVVEVSGIPMEDWIGRHVSVIGDIGRLTDAEVAAIEDAIDAVASGESTEERVELTPVVPHDLETLELRLTAFEPDGEKRRVVGFSRDVTERKRRERELERQNERLDEFAGVVSHDLRNPLAVLDGRLDLLEETGDPEHLTRCRRAVDRMDALIDDVLTLAREGKTVEDPDPVALPGVVRAAWRTVDTGDAQLRVETDATVRADPTRLQELLANLFRNCVEHGTPDESPSDAPDGDDPTVTVTVGDLDGRAGFHVSDDGVGIPPDERERVFETGYSTAQEGTGFGLRIVTRIAEAHGWDVAVAESADGGARFEFEGVEFPD